MKRHIILSGLFRHFGPPYTSKKNNIGTKERGIMAQPHPSLTLILDIDERIDSEELRLEVSRCYAHVCLTLVRTHPACEGDPENTARFLVKMGTKAYLDSSVEGADDLWSNSVERWLHNMLYKVSNNIRIFNKRQKNNGRDALAFTWMELDLQNGALCVRLRCNSVSAVDANVSSMIGTLRTQLNAGAIGKDVVRVTMPAPAEYEVQSIAGLEEKARREAQQAQQEQIEKLTEQARRAEAERQAEEAFLESPELSKQALLDETEDGPSSENAHGTEDEPETPAHPGGGEDIEELFSLDEPDFEIDYHVWEVTYANGSTRTFDSNAAKFIEVTPS